MKGKILSLFAFALIQFQLIRAQTSYPFKVATDRMLWHDKVDAQQKRIAEKSLPKDESIRLQVNDALYRRIDAIQQQVENDSAYNRNQKIRYLLSLESLVKEYNLTRGNKDFPASMAPELMDAFEEAMKLDADNKSILPVIEKTSYGVGKVLSNCFTTPSPNPGIEPAKQLLIRKYCALHPDEILPVLRSNPNLPFANEMIREAAGRDIRKLYNYAAARNELGNRIRKHPDSLVRMIGSMASSKSGQYYFPFLTQLLSGKLTLDQIDRVKGDDFAYYRLLVDTRIQYAARLLPPMKDTVTEMKALTDMLSSKAKQYFIREINALHSVENEAVRFKRLEGLTPQELYYLVVMGEDEIYTSSYLNVYKRIFQRMSTPRSDSLLMSVNGDYFRKFLKMAAGYNTLNDFLGKMDKENATTTMKAFVIKLENTNGLEEAVDVADSYSSIMDKNPSLAKYILDEVKWNYTRNEQAENKRGMVIYNLLKTLFESADTLNAKKDLSAELGIPSIYSKDYKTLQDSSGRVIQQVFFYGDEDKDGQLSFENFMGMFRGRSEWKIVQNENWVNISSTRGKPVIIFANKPLLGPDDPDARAQEKLSEYMAVNKYRPSIVIHRGHSYHLQYTLRQLAPSARIVVLGSCGGYNNLNDVLSICQDAHIISSKQVGTKTVNEPILQAINNNLVAGRSIDWINMWRELSGRFTDAASKEKFDDYIPPYKNLGAIFIRAYKEKMDN
jgi:hypothetical protein